jgi:hypothetical protein
MIRTMLATAALAIGVVSATGASAFERWVNIYNQAGSTLVDVRITHIGTRDWGPNILYTAISPGGVHWVEPVYNDGYCRFDILLTYADGMESSIMDVNLCEALDLYTDGYTYEIRTI